MADSKVRRYSLREEKRRIAAENPPIQIDLDDDPNPTAVKEGSKALVTTVVMEVPAAVTWTDDVLELSKKDPIGAAKLLVGNDDLYEKFVEQGGGASMLFAIAGQEDQGATAGE